jgi:hypothetical protein
MMMISLENLHVSKLFHSLNEAAEFHQIGRCTRQQTKEIKASKPVRKKV